ncbi:MAG: dodecin [Halomonas sp.]|uniref:dodecin n=1 Tax=Halomonas sp. TaxID=1486246 RepID=UPI003F8E86BD
MSHHTYKLVELTGSSEKGIEEAVQNALAKASQTIEHMRWLEVIDTRGHIEDGQVAHWQVTVKVGFTLE